MASSRTPVPKPRPQGPQRAESLGSQAAAAARAAAAFYRGWRSGTPLTDPMAVERQRQSTKYAIALNSYRNRVAALRARMVAGGTVAVGGAMVAASTLNGMPDEAPLAVLGGSAAALGAWQALRGRNGLQDLQEPSPPPALIAPPAPLPAGSPGADSAATVTGLRVHIVGLLPSVEQLHPQAADDIRAADEATAAGLNALVERIRSMQQIMAQLPGTTAAQSARLSIDALTSRLAEGVQAYQELLAAVITLSTAPAITGGPEATLRPAINEMHAYAAGLESAARTWR